MRKNTQNRPQGEGRVATKQVPVRSQIHNPKCDTTSMFSHNGPSLSLSDLDRLISYFEEKKNILQCCSMCRRNFYLLTLDGIEAVRDNGGFLCWEC